VQHFRWGGACRFPVALEKECKGWFTILRLYSPLEPFFDKSWRPSEIEVVK
jgi:hypothetical protein